MIVWACGRFAVEEKERGRVKESERETEKERKNRFYPKFYTIAMNCYFFS